MATLSELQAYRASLLKARGSAVREVQAGEKRIIYRTDSELEAAIAAVDREIGQLSGTPVRTVYLTTSKGT